MSPVHDADLNGDGSEKKAHIHFLVSFEGKKSFEQMQEITDRLRCPIPQACRNVRSMIRYMIHLDNPDKHQYRQDEIKCFGGFSVDDCFQPSQSEYRGLLKEVFAYIRAEHIVSYNTFLDRVMQEGRDDWFDLATCRNTLAIKEYIKSCYWQQQAVKEQMERDLLTFQSIQRIRKERFLDGNEDGKKDDPAD